MLDAIGPRPKRVLPIDHGPAADPHESEVTSFVTPQIFSRFGLPEEVPA